MYPLPPLTMFSEIFAALPLLMSLAAVSVAQDSIPAGSDSLPVQVDLYEDVIYNPPDAWHSGSNSTCGPDTTVDHFTAEVNATATFNFVGEWVIVYGVSSQFTELAFLSQATQSWCPVCAPILAAFSISSLMATHLS